MLRDTMQRLFTTFPNSAPGLALLILRVMIGAPLVVSAASGGGTANGLPEWLALGARLLVGLCLCAGFWTPLATALVGIAELWTAYTTTGLADSHLLRGGIALCLTLLGPGAWSVDARLFGRKRLRFGTEGDDAAR